MQLMALNALLLFDAIFIFFLFLVSVSCLLYYLPLVPPTRTSSFVNEGEMLEDERDIESGLDSASGHHHHHHDSEDNSCANGQQPPHPHHSLFCHSHSHRSGHDGHNCDYTQVRTVEVEMNDPDLLPGIVHDHPPHFDQADYDDDEDDDQILYQVENDQKPSSNYNRTSIHQNPNALTQLSPVHQVNPTLPDNPTTHIILNLPQRKYYKSSVREGKGFAPIETV